MKWVIMGYKIFPGDVFDERKIDCDITQYVVDSYLKRLIICIFICVNICISKLMTML